MTFIGMWRGGCKLQPIVHSIPSFQSTTAAATELRCCHILASVPKENEFTKRGV